MKVLVIDDDSDLLDNISFILNMAAYHVIRAGNGLDGLRLAHEQKPEIILCDIVMPEMTGYEVLEELQASSITATIPFIFLSSKAELQDIRQGMAIGADDYLTKPFNEAALLAAIEKRLEKRQHLALEERLRFSQRLLQEQEESYLEISQDLDESLRRKLLHLKFWSDSQSSNPNASREMLFAALEKSLHEIIGELNRISYKLHPAMLPQLGLVLSLQWFFSQETILSRIPNLKFETYAMNERLAANLELGIYRIIQRVFEHLPQSEEEIGVVLWSDEQTLHLSISQLPRLDKQDYGQLFQLLEGYAQLIGASISFRHEDYHSAIYLSVNNVVFRDIERVQFSQIRDDKEQSLLVVSPDSSFLKRMENYSGLKHPFTAHSFTDLDTLFNQINRYEPTITILDILIDPQILRVLSKKTSLIVLLPHADENLARQSLQEGIMGIIPKSRAEREIVPAIQTIMQGEAYISASFLVNKRSASARNSFNLDSLLTLREREILDLILADLTHSDIAEKLVISPRTVEKHRANIMQKLGLSSHTELILFALRHGLIVQG